LRTTIISRGGADAPVEVMEGQGNVAWTFARVFSSPWTLATEAVVFAIYWFVFYDLVRYASSGFFLVEVPVWLLVVFVFSSSVLATLAITYLRAATRKRRSALGMAQSPIMVAAGTAVVTCACNIPLLGPFLYFIGMNSVGVSVVISEVARIQEPLVTAMIAVNALTAVYYLRLIGSAHRQGYSSPGLRTG